jgi:bifunctional DNA-binding transcriptional regulator/antitoxin component of YhaV-PrlF toxin-antitoxin module
MTVLTVTSKGQVTLKKDVLQHLGVKPGGKIVVDILPDGKATMQAMQREKGIESIFGLLAHPDNPVLTIEEIKKITEDAWAGKR